MKELVDSNYNFDDNVKKIVKKLYLDDIDVTLVDKMMVGDDVYKLRFQSPVILKYHPGTFVILKANVDGKYISRPYSILTKPDNNNYFEVSIRCIGLFSNYLTKELKINEKIKADIGKGFFFYDQNRDGNNLCFIASGIEGVMPILPIVLDLANKQGLNVVIFYENNGGKNVLNNLPDNFKVINLIDRKIDIELLKEYVKSDYRFYISGMEEDRLRFISLLETFGVNKLKIRSESLINTFEKITDNEYEIIVNIGVEKRVIKVKGNMTLERSLVDNNIIVKTSCRNGFCGTCKAFVLKGKYIVSTNDFRRKAEKDSDIIYLCETHPNSDMEIKINII